MHAVLEPEVEACTLSATETVAEIRRVSKHYRDGVVALDDLSLTLRRGEIVALLGPNGAGKSTAIKLLMGLSAPTRGTVRVFGEDPRSAAHRLRTGAMLQVGRAPETLKVREHIELFRGYYPHPVPVSALLHTAGLGGLEERLFGQLSGGQKQRVLFALALAGDPDLVFLDEPTVGLDIEARRSMWRAIEGLAAAGKTVLLTTHYLEEADALASRILVVNKGRVVCEGTPAQVKAQGAAGATGRDAEGASALPFKIIRCTTALSLETLHTLEGVTHVELCADRYVDQRADRYVARRGGRTALQSTTPERTVLALLQRDPTLVDLEVVSPALEDAFLALTAA